MKSPALLSLSVAAMIVAIGVLSCGPKEDRISDAWALFEKGRAFDARDIAVEMAARPPEELAERVRLADLLVAVREQDRAVRLLTGERLDPHGKDVLAMALLRSGRADAAEKILSGLYRDRDDSALTNRLMGEYHVIRRDARAARRELLKSLERDATDPLAHVYLAETWRMEGKDERAEQELRGTSEAVRATPELRAHLGYVVMTRRGSGDDPAALGEAVEHLRFAAERRPLDEGTRTTLGVALRRLGKPKEAARVFQALVDDFPDSAEHLSNLGVALLEAGEPAMAVRMLERAREVGPARMDTLMNLGNAYLELLQRSGKEARAEQARRAKAVFEEAAKKDPRSPLPLVGIARSIVKENPAIRTDAQDWSEGWVNAIGYYSKALARDPGCFPAHLNKALLHYELWANSRPGSPGAEKRGENWRLALFHFDAAARLEPPEKWNRYAREVYGKIEKTRDGKPDAGSAKEPGEAPGDGAGEDPK